MLLVIALVVVLVFVERVCMELCKDALAVVVSGTVAWSESCGGGGGQEDSIVTFSQGTKEDPGDLDEDNSSSCCCSVHGVFLVSTVSRRMPKI